MTRINWDEVEQLSRLDEIIAYSIITLQEAYTEPQNDDFDNNIAINDVSDWIRWEIAYDEQGRAFFRYAASLYVVDRTPLADRDFLALIYSPTKWLVTHADPIALALRTEDTSLKIDPMVDIPVDLVTSLEKLLFWAVVLGDWWNRTLKYIANTETPDIPTDRPSWGEIPAFPAGYLIEGEDNGSSIDAQFDEYNGKTDDPALPDFLKNILDRQSNGTGNINQTIDLPLRDAGNYRENLVTCEEQDPKLINFSQQQLAWIIHEGLQKEGSKKPET
jgi:hypothetical protein